MNNLFDNFKKSRQLTRTTSRQVPVFFLLNFDSHGAYVEVTDEKGKAIEVSYQDYSGATRSVLRSLEQIKEQTDFNISWENPSALPYLHEYEYLIDQLKPCDNFLDYKKNPIAFEEQPYRFSVTIEPKDTDNQALAPENLPLQAKISLVSPGQTLTDFLFVNENYAFTSGKLLPLEPVGKFFSNLLDFETSFPVKDLSKYLSLLFSYTEKVNVSYEDFRIEERDDKIVAEPCLFFEKVDVDNSLHLRVGQSIARVGVDFLDEFEVYRIAEINDMEKVISLRYIEEQPLENYVHQIQKAILKYDKSGKRKTSEVVLDHSTFIIPEGIAGDFIYNELPGLLTTYRVFGAEKLKMYRITTRMPKLDVSLGHGIDFLEGDVSLDFGTEKISLFDAISQFEKNRYVLLSDGSHALLNDAYIQKLQRLFKKKKEKVQLSFFDLPLVEELLDEKVTESAFSQTRKFFTGINELSKKPVRLPEVNADLRPYQEQGFNWMNYLHDNRLNGCLADDMGLGKTLQTITLLAKFYPPEPLPTLIIMPKSLLFNWDKEVKKFAPQLTTYTYYDKQRNLNEALEHHLIFTTYAMLRNDIEAFKEEKFFYVILDESQNIKNLQAQTTKAVMLLNAQHRLALSGTPIENNLAELYSLFRFLNPTMFGTPEQFNSQYLIPVQKNNDPDIMHELRRKIYPFILRRLKKDVLKELPDKIEQVLYVEMSDEQAKLYEQRRQFYKQAIEVQIATKGVQQSQFYIFQALSELRQIASLPESKSDGLIVSPKLELLAEQLQEALVNKHKALVFVNFLNALELIGEQLENQGIEYVSMSGSTRDRQALVERFQKDPECKVFLMTLKTGGTGLNLTAADMVFIFDPWWNKAAENQAIDRSHRIGQDKTVWSYKLIARHTIEEKMLQLQERKAELFNNLISADSASLKSFSEDDIDFILGK